MDPEDLTHINNLLDQDADLREVLFHCFMEDWARTRTQGESTERTANRGQAMVPLLVLRLHQKYMDVALILHDLRQNGRLPLRRAPTRTVWRSSSCDNVGSKFGM